MGFRPQTFWEIRKGLALMMEKTSHHVLSEFGHFLRLQGTNISPPKSRRFWVDDFPNFPFGGICIRSLEGFPASIMIRSGKIEHGEHPARTKTHKMAEMLQGNLFT